MDEGNQEKQNLPWRDAIEAVLRETGSAMHYTEIAEKILEQGLRTDVGATPAASANTAVNIEMKTNGDQSVFTRVGKGQYVLRETERALTDGKSAQEMEEERESREGIIQAFGMWWRRDMVIWDSSPKLLGQQQNAEVVDFGPQKGIYILHDGRGTVYVGRTTDQPLGRRLGQHTTDRLNGRWDRFSWFGLLAVEENGELSSRVALRTDEAVVIAALEALLIEALEPPQNRKRGDDFRAVEYLQVADPKLEERQMVDLLGQVKDRWLKELK